MSNPSRAVRRLVHLVVALPVVAAFGCGPDVPKEWAEFVPTDNIMTAFPAEDDGKVAKFAANYKREGMTGDALRGKISERAEKAGFTKISECTADNGTSSAMFVNEGKEVFQTAINVLGDEFFDVDFQRGKDIPGVELPDPTNCKFTDAAAKYCELEGSRCTFK